MQKSQGCAMRVENEDSESVNWREEGGKQEGRRELDHPSFALCSILRAEEQRGFRLPHDDKVSERTTLKFRSMNGCERDHFGL